MKKNLTVDKSTRNSQKTSNSKFVPVFFWVLATFMVAVLIFVTFQFISVKNSNGVSAVNSAVTEQEISSSGSSTLPEFEKTDSQDYLLRFANPRTIIPTRARKDVISYTIQSGDSVFGIAQKFNIKPETILWANKDTLNDDPHMISVDQELRIPPIDGVYYKVKEGDTIQKIADEFKVDAEAIMDWTPNKIDRTDPQITPETYVMVPGGQREFQVWVVPTIPRGPAGVNGTIPGACDTSGGGAYGTGTFIWPTNNQFISGNDYWSGHLAIDIGAMTGDAVFASDSGVVVYAGSISGGYGNMIMIDHGNGYQTLYAHLSAINVRCGSSVYQGNVIGAAGSTGNSTGPHLHFEVRYFGGFINPHFVLP